MIVIIGILLYAGLAAVAMFFAVVLNRKYRVIDEWDIGICLAFVSIFWPIAFPVYAAYIVANGLGQAE